MEAVTVTLHSIIEAGDEVIVPSPNWPNLKWAVVLAGGVPVEVPLCQGVLTADAIAGAVTEKTKAVVLSSPGNPVGTVTSAHELERIAAVVKEKDFLVLSDETYSRLFYGGNTPGAVAPSIMAVPAMAERTVVLSTFSKTYAMDGWRLGWALLRPRRLLLLRRGIISRHALLRSRNMLAWQPLRSPRIALQRCLRSMMRGGVCL
ncbi:unnamed protein product [Polarella glacialis]|uniref:Aminotransferase class I/classII large domain-containing protein n=1 Tax=Polarella glacialis TaxID=89957 RepID=A0A813JL90_POLGL|nr:unnamed protein product [Polarella glacialis]